MGWLGFLMMLMVIHALRGMNTIPFQDIDKESSCCPLHGLDADANSWSKRRANMLRRVEFQDCIYNLIGDGLTSSDEGSEAV
jgi:hypothetical protein